MLNMPLRSVSDAFHEAWRLRWPVLLSQLIFNILVLAVLAPITTVAVRTAIALSGKPALSDFDIAMFLLSPTGFVALVVVASLLLTTYVLDVSFMMAIALHARRTGERKFEEGIGRVLPRIPRIIGFSWRLLLRSLAVVAPFVVLVLVVAQRKLTEFDINYYLKEHPPEFVQAVIIIGVILAIMAIVLGRYLLRWAVALPLVLFEDTAPRDSFAESAEAMKGKQLDLLVSLLVWGLVSAIALAVTLGAVGLVADAVTGEAGANLRRLAAWLLLLTGLWSVLNLLVSAVSTGALAVLLLERAGWPGTVGAAREIETHHPVLRPALLIGLLVGAVLMVAGFADLSSHRVTDTVEVIAHRGAAGQRPENTMAAFSKAIEDEATWVELDVQESAEGEIIVVHDSDFMKLAGVGLKAWDATAKDLAEIDIGSWYDAEYAGERTPTLLEVLELAKDTGSGVLIELKYYGHDVKLEQRVAEVVEQAEMMDQVQLMSLKYEGVQKMKTLRPDWSVGLLATAAVGKVWELDADFLAMNMELVRPGLVKSTKAAGKKIYVWTVNDPLGMSAMLSLGVNGLITDEPALAREVIAQRESLSTLERLVLALGHTLGLNSSHKEYRDGSP